MTLPDGTFRLIGDDGDGRRAVQRMRNEVNRLGRDAGRAGTQVERMSRRLSNGTSANRRFALGVQNASFQVGDFAVQMASGTHWIRAASQQLPQLLGGMGVLGAVAGAGTAIIGALVLGLIDLGDESEGAAGGVKTLKDSLDNLSSSRSGIQQLISLQQEYNRAIADGANTSTRATNVIVANTKREFEARQVLLKADLLDTEKAIDQHVSTITDLTAKQNELRGKMTGLSTLSGQRAGAGLETGSVGSLYDRLAADEAEVSNALQAASANMDLALIRATELREAMTAVFDVTGTGGFGVDPSSGGKSGRGNTKTPLETTIERHVNAIRELTKETQKGLGASSEAWSGYFGDLVSMTGSNNARLLGLAKSFGAASALINAWQAHNLVLADPTLPWWARLASAAKVLAAGLGAVNAIKSVSAGGGGGRSGGTSSTTTTTPNTSQNQSLTLQLLGEPWQQAMLESLARQLIPALNQAQENGGQLNISVGT